MPIRPSIRRRRTDETERFSSVAWTSARVATSPCGFRRQTARATADLLRSGAPAPALPCYASAMHQGLLAPPGRGTYRATITGVGRPGPIEERVGWRLLR